MSWFLWLMSILTILAMWRTKKRSGPAALILSFLLVEWALLLFAFRLPSAGLMLAIGACYVLDCGMDWLMSSALRKSATPE